MVMTDAEIRHKYEKADNKKEMVQILADLNGCNKAQMRAKLQELGLVAKNAAVPGINDEIAMNLYNSGMPDKDMAEELNVGLSSIVKWRRFFSLSPNKAPKRAPAGRKMLLKDLAPLLVTLAERYPDAQVTVGGVPLMSLHLQADMDAMGFVRRAAVALETEEVGV